MFDKLEIMKRNKFIALCVIPMTFILIILLLNNHLSSSVVGESSKKVHLISAYGGQAGPKRFESESLKLKEVLDFRYDTDRLAVMGQVKDAQDELTRSEGKTK